MIKLKYIYKINMLLIIIILYNLSLLVNLTSYKLLKYLLVYLHT